MITNIENDPIVEKQVGRKNLQMRESHKLPLYYSECPLYDRALPRICKKVKEIDGYLSVVDVGANIGDTVSLITDEVQGSFLCIDGDKDYLQLLRSNIDKIKDSRVFIEESYCSKTEKNGEGFEIERNNGTAKIILAKESGVQLKAQFKALDNIIETHAYFKDANVLKIDTDGFEIDVLDGGIKFLNYAKPVLYFEFTPDLYLGKGQNPLYIFELLNKNGYEEVMFYDNFGKPVGIIKTYDQSKIEEFLRLIDNSKIYYYDILAVHNSKSIKYRSLFENELFSSIELLGFELNSLNSKFNSIKIDLDVIKSELDLAKLELGRVFASREWMMILMLQKIVKKIIPVGSLRRKTAGFILKTAKKIVKFIFGIARGVKNSVLFLSQYSLRFKPKKKRKINKNSKKLVYIGHSYHNKTKSTVFLIEYLKQFYDVEVVLDESWNGGTYPNLSFIDESYLGVIFFQLLPPVDIIKNIKNDNIMYFPMYDQSGGLGLDFWYKYRDIKIINFSKTLHEKLAKWGLDSMFIQYFPNPQEFVPGKRDEVFFWQRLTKMNIGLVSKLFGKMDVKMHIHKAIDPDQQFQQPSEEQEKKFQIAYSDWFETREQMWDVIKQKGIYIAPREYEGIGQSFLEAMAMGKAVVAVNNPTMNEYIEHEKNGYLFDLKNPKEIDFSNIEQVQKNTHEFMKKGFEKWENDKKKIIEFIEKS